MHDNDFKPESLMMTHGYQPELSEGSLKTPIFQTSTFVFKTAEEGKAFFSLAYGLREKNEGEELGLIYSRINNPNLEILENRLSIWDKADDSVVFSSGMSAITTVLLEFLKPGDLLLHSGPIYGGTDHFIKKVLIKYDVSIVSFTAKDSKEDIIKKVEATGKANKLKLIYTETPANPTNAVLDIEMCREIADHFSKGQAEKVRLAVDNTYMGPVWSNPIKHGADLVLYSATKYIGGHSDLVAGVVSGTGDSIARVKTFRVFLGNMPNPWTCWLMMRSLETLKLRMEKQALNASQVANFLKDHSKINNLSYLGFIERGSKQYEIFKKQYSSAGAMLSFEVGNSEAEAFKFLNSLKLTKLAVSLGSTESLAQHPSTMTHADVSIEDQRKLGITSSLVRFSVGVEDHEDLIKDIRQALETV